MTFPEVFEGLRRSKKVPPILLNIIGDTTVYSEAEANHFHYQTLVFFIIIAICKCECTVVLHSPAEVVGVGGHIGLKSWETVP